MQRLKLFLLSSFLLILPLSAASFVPVKSMAADDIFRSPALLAHEENDSGFGFSVGGYADIDMLNFIADPALTLGSAADYLRDELLGKDDQYLLDNYESISSIFRFDPRFPEKHADVSENAYYIRDYLERRFEEIGDGNRARSVFNALSSDLGIFPDDTSGIINGDMDLTLDLHAGGIKDGFGWNGRMRIIYDGASSLLDSFSYGDYAYGSTLYFTLGGSVGYGAYITENLAFGLSVTPEFVFRTTSASTSLLSSRINGNLIEFLASNRFDFGVGLDMVFGFMLDAGDNAKILLDFRSLPSIEMFWYFSADDVMSGFKFHEDSTIYYAVPDAALGLIWERGDVRIEAELSGIASQIVLMSVLPFYSFDILSVPHFSFRWALSESFAIETGYDFRKVYLGCSFSSIQAELSTRLDKPGFGISFGCEF